MQPLVFAVAGFEAVSCKIAADSFLPGVKRTALMPDGKINRVVVLVQPGLQGCGQRVAAAGDVRQIGGVVLAKIPDILNGFGRRYATG